MATSSGTSRILVRGGHDAWSLFLSLSLSLSLSFFIYFLVYTEKAVFGCITFAFLPDDIICCYDIHNTIDGCFMMYWRFLLGWPSRRLQSFVRSFSAEVDSLVCLCCCPSVVLWQSIPKNSRFAERAIRPIKINKSDL